MAADFHPRYQKTLKTYEYRILNRRVPLPNQRLNSYFVPQPLDLEAMSKAAEEIIGTHDFHNFCSVKTKVTNTVRTITNLTLTREEDMICLRITGDGFLYNMVRIIVGGLLKVGFHKKTAPTRLVRCYAHCKDSPGSLSVSGEHSSPLRVAVHRFVCKYFFIFSSALPR